jgi:LysR family transcriptional regulator, cell division regulator
MDAADLKVFEAVARLGGMNRAASELNTVQSNVTTRVRQLEDELGTPLFQRHSRGVVLTDAGRRLLPYAQRIAQLLSEAKRATLDEGRPRGALAIGSLETTAALRLSPRLAAYAAAYPEVDIGLRTGTSAELIEDVLQHRVEGAMVCGPVEHPDLVEEVFYREELVVLSARDGRTLDDVLRRPDLKIIVLRIGCSYRQMLESILARRGVVGLRRLEFGTLEAIYGCVAAGLGVTLLPKSLIGTVWRDGRVAVHPLPPEDALVETVFIRRRDGYVSSALEAFLRMLRPAAVSSAAAE